MKAIQLIADSIKSNSNFYRIKDKSLIQLIGSVEVVSMMRKKKIDTSFIYYLAIMIDNSDDDDIKSCIAPGIIAMSFQRVIDKVMMIYNTTTYDKENSMLLRFVFCDSDIYNCIYDDNMRVVHPDNRTTGKILSGSMAISVYKELLMVSELSKMLD